MITNPLPIYLGLAVIGGVSLLLDTVGHKGKPTTLSAVLWTLFWIAVGLGFGGYVYFVGGSQAASEYYSGYLMEKALSFDNLMVFIAIFAYFNIKDANVQHKVLTYGIIGAVLFRGIFVGAGSWLFHLHWTVQCLFGAIVIYSAKSLIKDDEDETTDFDKVWYIRFLRSFYPIDTSENPTRFFTVVNGLRHATPLLLCVFAIEFSDVLFSFDSVPAVIGVSKEAPIIYSAMIMAVLGLRALYFVIELMVEKLHLLGKFVALILVFIGLKLWAGAAGFELDPTFSLVVVGILLVGGVVASLIIPKKVEVTA